MPRLTMCRQCGVTYDVDDDGGHDCPADRPSRRPSTPRPPSPVSAISSVPLPAVSALGIPQSVEDKKDDGIFDLQPIDIPEEYLCPISREIMRDPVMLIDDGFTYERKEIEGYFAFCAKEKKVPVSPSTGLKATFQQLKPNFQLKKAIDRFLQQNPLLNRPGRIVPSLDEGVARSLHEQQEQVHQQKLRRRVPFFVYLQHLKAYLEKRGVLGKHSGVNNYDVFISYAWEDQDKKNLQAHQKLQSFLMCIHDDLQRIGLNVFFDCKDMSRNMKEVMEASIARSGIILSMCKPFLQEAVKNRPTGNIALEVNCTLKRARQNPEALLPLLLDGTWDDAMPEPMLAADVPQSLSHCQDIRPLFFEFDPHNPFSANYMNWMVNHLIPRILQNAGIPANDLFLATLSQSFYSQNSRRELEGIHQMTPRQQFEHNYRESKDSSAERYYRVGFKAFEFTLMRLRELTLYHQARGQKPEKQAMLVYVPSTDPRFMVWIHQFHRHLQLAGLQVSVWQGQGAFQPKPAESVVVICNPLLKQIMEAGLAQPNSSWSQLQQHLASSGVVCYPVIYQGDYASAVPNWSHNYQGRWYRFGRDTWNKSFLARNTSGRPLDFPSADYYELMIGIDPKGLLRDLLWYEDNDVAYNALCKNFQWMQGGWGTKDLFKLSKAQSGAEEEAALLYTQGRDHFDHCRMQQAYEAFQKAAAAQYLPAYLWLYILVNSNFIPKNAEQAAYWKTFTAQHIQWLRRATQRGQAEAQTNLAFCFHVGIGVAQDPVEAARLYRLAVDQGYARAQNNLGTMYSAGVGAIPRDLVEAARLFHLAADQGYHLAQHNLGICYQQGHGVPKDESEFVRLYRLATNQGFSWAQNNLAVCYRNGTVVTQDFVEAVRLFRLSAEQGYMLAQNNLGDCYRDGIGIPQDVIEALRFYRLAAEQGHASAQTNLGALHHIGIGVAQDPVEALRFYRLAAEQGEASAQTNLGDFYKEGIGVAQNPVEAVRLYRLAAAQGYARAQINLGRCCQNGIGVAQDPVEAVRLFRLASEQGYVLGTTCLGVCYRDGIGIAKDEQEAVRLLRLATDQQHAAAQYNLGICYRDGIGVPENIMEAIAWFRLAAAQGYAEAKEELARLEEFVGTY